MTSLDINRIPEALRRLDPQLENILARDARALDKAWSGDIFDFVAYATFAEAFVLGVDAWSCYRLVHGIKHTTFLCKGDAFNVFNNSSGNDITVELNGENISIGDRYAYYRKKYPHGLPTEIRELLEHYRSNFFVSPIPVINPFFNYRERNTLRTYGDDNLKSSLDRYDPVETDIWRYELGIEMTDENKNAEIKERPFSEVSFLKRHFVFDEELQSFLPPLDKKSICRMLLWKKDNTLSDLDHASVTLTCASREIVYHGKDLHDEFTNWARKLSQEKGLDANPYLDLKDYDQWRAILKEGSFQTWWNGDPVPHVVEEIPDTLITRQMSTVSMVNAGNDPAHAADQTSTSLNLVTPVTTVISDSSVITNVVPEEPQFFQKMPNNEISDYVSRLTEIGVYTLTAADTAAVTFSLDPWTLYMANAAIISKMANFALIKAEMEVVFMITAPGACYGSYVFSCLPNGSDGAGAGGTAEIVAPTLKYENCMQVDHYARVDLAASENVVFQLPWVFPFDYAVLPAGPVNMWAISCSCLQPVTTAIAGGVATATIKVYARLLPGYELVVPRLQGKRHGHLHPTHVTEMAIPHIHATLQSALVSAPPSSTGADLPPNPTHGKMSVVADKVASAANILSKVPVIGPYAQTAAKAAHAVSKVAGFFGFTRETAESNVENFTGKSISNVAHFEGPDPSMLASLSSVNEIGISPTLNGGSSTDVTSLASLYPRWTLVHQFTWATSSPQDFVLSNHVVAPSFCRNTNRELFLTTAGYVGLPFQYWRGDMEFMIVVPVSKMHRGTLQILWIPEGTTLTSEVTNRTMNIIFDVTAGEELCFRVGYAREAPYLENRLITSAVTILPFGATNGRIFYRVVNPLVAQTAVAGTRVSVFARAGQNMDFAVPREEFPYVDTVPSVQQFALKNSIVYQGKCSDDVTYQGTIGDDETNDVYMRELVPSSGGFPGEILFFGERFDSVRALMQKPSILRPKNALTTANLIRSPMLGPVNVSAVPTADFDQWWNWFGHYRLMYVAIACSERFKIISNNGNTYAGGGRFIGSSANAPGTLSTSTMPGTLFPMQFMPYRGTEITIPWYFPQKFLRGFCLYPTTGGNRTMNGLSIFPYTGTDRCVVYHSAGPDLRVSFFRQVPTIVVSALSSPVTGGSWFNP